MSDDELKGWEAQILADHDEEMNLREILTNYRDHDGLGWPATFAYLRTYDARRIADLTASVAREGFKEPIYLGPGVVLDGLHRLAVADALDWRMLPVLHADPKDVDGIDIPALIQEQDDLNGRLSAELERLGKGVERIAAKHGADHPEVAEALHLLLRDRAS